MRELKREKKVLRFFPPFFYFTITCKSFDEDKEKEIKKEATREIRRSDEEEDALKVRKKRSGFGSRKTSCRNKPLEVLESA